MLLFVVGGEWRWNHGLVFCVSCGKNLGSITWARETVTPADTYTRKVTYYITCIFYVTFFYLPYLVTNFCFYLIYNYEK